MSVKKVERTGKVTSVTYEAQTPSFVTETGVKVQVPGHGSVSCDVVWTGEFYPIVDATALGFGLVRTEEHEIVRFAKAFLESARKTCHPMHPAFGDEGPLSFLVLAGPLAGNAGDGWERRLCTYLYPENNVCRGPGGTLATAAAAQLLQQGALRVGETLRAVSIFETDLYAKITSTEHYHGCTAARAAVTGSGWITMRSQVVADFSDPLTPRDGLPELLTR